MNTKDVLFERNFDFNESIDNSFKNIEKELSNIQEELQHLGMFFMQEKKLKKAEKTINSIKKLDKLKRSISNTKKTKTIKHKDYYTQQGQLHFYLYEDIAKVRNLELSEAIIRGCRLGINSLFDLMKWIFSIIKVSRKKDSMYKIIKYINKKENYCLSTKSSTFKHSIPIELTKEKGTVYFDQSTSLDKVIETLRYIGERKKMFFNQIVLIFKKDIETIPEEKLGFFSLSEYWYGKTPKTLVFKDKEISVESWVDLLYKISFEVLQNPENHYIPKKENIGHSIKNYLTYKKNKYKNYKKIKIKDQKPIYMKSTFGRRMTQVKIEALIREINCPLSYLKVGF